MINKAPQLAYDTTCNTWVLWLQGYYDHGSFCMMIDHSWDGESWNTYRFYSVLDGEWYRCLTREEYKQRVADIGEHEGPEAASLWEIEQDTTIIIGSTHPVFKLREHWEILTDKLGLFTPHVTLNVRWPDRLPGEDLRKRMNEAYMKWRFEV